MNKYYPQKRGNLSRQLPTFGNGFTHFPINIIPNKVGSDRNLAGQVTVHVHIKNSRGEEMDFYQTQQMLNTSKNTNGSWRLDDGMNEKHRKEVQNVYKR